MPEVDEEQDAVAQETDSGALTTESGESPALNEHSGRRDAPSARRQDDTREAASPSDEPTTRSATTAQAADRPWPVLSVALLVLFASLGGNAYLLWLAAGARRQYRALVSGQRRGASDKAPPWDAGDSPWEPRWEEVGNDD